MDRSVNSRSNESGSSQIDWRGISMILLCAVTCAFVVPTIIIAREHAEFYSQAPYRLEGGEAFSTHAPVNFLVLGALALSGIIVLCFSAYCVFNTDDGFTAHKLISGAFLLPSLYLFFVVIRGFL
jgi:hypothetical protein